METVVNQKGASRALILTSAILSRCFVVEYCSEAIDCRRNVLSRCPIAKNRRCKVRARSANAFLREIIYTQTGTKINA